MIHIFPLFLASFPISTKDIIIDVTIYNNAVSSDLPAQSLHGCIAIFFCEFVVADVVYLQEFHCDLKNIMVE